MSDTVFANGMSIACKVSSGKTIAAMPDVCLSPPSPPAGPIPIPYPNTASASDTDKGSKTVQIGGDAVMLKDKSVFKTSTGNEAATKSFGMSIVTHEIQGEASFVVWSMDVKIEGENVPRHLDLMGHNEACNPTATPPWPFMASAAAGQYDPCRVDKEKEQAACGTKSETEACEDAGCQAARKCKLVPYRGPAPPDKKNCCDGLTGHHLIEDHWVKGLGSSFPMAQGQGYYDAPTVCCLGDRFELQHGLFHSIQGVYEDSFLRGANAGKTFTYARGKEASLRAHDITFNGSCQRKCIAAQLDGFYGADTNPSRPLNQPTRLQSVAKTPDSEKIKLLRDEAEQYIDMRFGSTSLP